MFKKNNKEELNKLFVDWIRRFLQPNFVNKITKTLVIFGISIIAMPIPIKVIICNFIINTFNINNNEQFKISDIGNTSGDYWLGFSIISLALIYNAFNIWMISKDKTSSRKEKAKVNDKNRAVDIKLFNDFKDLLSSKSSAINLLKEHDFGTAFSYEHLESLKTFKYDWHTSEKSFINNEIELLKLELWEDVSELISLINLNTRQIRSGFLHVVPEQYIGKDDWPQRFDDAIEKLNFKATKVFQAHQEFIIFCKKELNF